MSNTSLEQSLEELCRQAGSDETLGKRLLQEPESVLEEKGVHLPEDMRVKILQEDNAFRFYLLPKRLAPEELTIQELKEVAGGLPFSWLNTA